MNTKERDKTYLDWNLYISQLFQCHHWRKHRRKVSDGPSRQSFDQNWKQE
jgi:hypothetical protein